MAMADVVRLTLESTDEIAPVPPPARIWRGFSREGAPIVAWISILAGQTGDATADARMREALETRIASSAVIEIPVRRGG